MVTIMMQIIKQPQIKSIRKQPMPRQPYNSSSVRSLITE